MTSKSLRFKLKKGVNTLQEKWALLADEKRYLTIQQRFKERCIIARHSRYGTLDNTFLRCYRFFGIDSAFVFAIVTYLIARH